MKLIDKIKKYFNKKFVFKKFKKDHIILDDYFCYEFEDIMFKHKVDKHGKYIASMPVIKYKKCCRC